MIQFYTIYVALATIIVLQNGSRLVADIFFRHSGYVPLGMICGKTKEQSVESQAHAQGTFVHSPRTVQRT